MGLISGLSFELILILSLLVIGAGVIVRYGTILYQKRCANENRWYHSDKQLTWKELAISVITVLLVVLPLSNLSVHHMAQASAVSGYQEFWNGSIIAAMSQDYTCERDGVCVHTYQCDPYEVWESYTDYETRTRTVTRTDSEGKSYSTTETYTEAVTKWHWVTHYHSCPYATSEHSFWLKDSLGQTFTIASHIFAANARAWRSGSGLPNVSQGIPQQWADAKAAIERGDDPPSTKTNDYVNYLLAASDSLLKAYSDKIDAYREQGLIPDHTRNMKSNPIHDSYMADKAVFVKMDLDTNDYNAWQDALGKLNSQLGTERQGDLHMLAVPASAIDNPDDYANALLAEWQSRQYGKEGLAKNAIMLVIGVSADGKSVQWARAKTGIPEGNGEMLAALSLQLADTQFTPQALLGSPAATWNGEGEGNLSFTPSDGIVEQIILRDHPFLRPCMMCNDEGDSGQGYVYLKDSALLPSWAPWVLGTIVFMVALGLFGFMVAVDFGEFVKSMAYAVKDIAVEAWRKVRQALNNLLGRG